ncbi:MAG: low temperature requirement protein A [Geothrix sp.]|nr:low temperature requirement protein A [Geothrix sp.]
MGHGTAPVTQVELFFDLVFVFAVTQLSAELRANLGLLGFLHTVMLFAAVWWVWVYTSWVTNWLEPKYRPVRVMVLVLMLLGLVLSTAVPDAFGGRGLAFAAAYVAMQLGRSLFMLWAVRGFDAGNFRNMGRISFWFLASGVFWIAGGVWPDPVRTWLWLAALGLDFVAPALGYYTPGLGRSATTDWVIDSYHLAERCAGFILIALGESIAATGEAFYALRWSQPEALAFPAAFVGVVALWWIYFDRAAERNADVFAQSEDPGRIARAAYTYVHALLVAGIIAVAAGDGLLLEHPGAAVSLPAGLMLLGGPALYLLGNGIFRRLVHPHFPVSHTYGLLFLTLLVPVVPELSLLSLAWAVAAALVGVIAISEILVRRQERR